MLQAQNTWFTPQNISKLVAWWDPDVNLTTDPSTMRVSSWVDRVNSIAATQATGGSQPLSTTVFHGRTSVNYTGNRFLSGSFSAGTFTLGKAFTFCAAIRVSAGSGATGAVFDSSPTTTTNSGNMVFLEANSWKLRQFAPLTDTSWATTPPGTELMLVARGSTTSRDLWVNGVKVANNTATLTLPAVTNFQFGYLFGSIYPFTGYTGDVAIYNRALTDAEIGNLYTLFFKPKWGV